MGTDSKVSKESNENSFETLSSNDLKEYVGVAVDDIMTDDVGTKVIFVIGVCADDNAKFWF